LHRLNRGRRNRGFNDMNTADVVRKLCDEYTLNADADVESEVKPFRLQRNFTDYEYLLNLKDEHNCYLWSNNKTVYFKKEADFGKDETVLEKGKTLTSFYGGSQSGRLFTEVVVRGRNPATLDFIEVIADASSVKKKTGGNTASPEYLEEKFSKHREYYTDYTIKDVKEAEERGANILEQNSMKYIRFTGECQGDPKIKAGMVITIKGMGEIYSGEYFLKQVEHELKPMTGYVTSFEAVRNARNVKKGAGLATGADVRPAKKEEKGKLVKNWIEIRLLDEQTGEPIVQREYTIKFDDGSERTGTTDDNGFLFEDDIPSENYELMFDDLDIIKEDGKSPEKRNN
jgi:phage protein D